MVTLLCCWVSNTAVTHVCCAQAPSRNKSSVKRRAALFNNEQESAGADVSCTVEVPASGITTYHYSSNVYFPVLLFTASYIEIGARFCLLRLSGWDNETIPPSSMWHQKHLQRRELHQKQYGYTWRYSICIILRSNITTTIVAIVLRIVTAHYCVNDTCTR